MENNYLAPNGKKSNLTNSQYKLVRTKAFKHWFGDWENDPKNASKVVDENGEPLVVYHGSKSFDISEFELLKSKRKSSGLKEYGTYFTDNKKLAEAYRNWSELKPEVQKEIDIEIKKWDEIRDKARSNRDYDNAELQIKLLKESKKGKNYAIFLNLRKVKVFDAKGNINIEAWNNLKVEASYKLATNRDAMEFLKYGKFGVEKVDGIIAKNIVDAFVQTEDLKKELLSNVYLVFDSKNIKLADGSNTTFDSNNTDIRFDEGGQVDEYAQQLIDIISINPQLEKYEKYKVILKDKFGINFNYFYKDDYYIENANLLEIKDKDDFINYDKYIEYAKKIFKLRGLINDYHAQNIEGIISIEKAIEIGEKLNIIVNHREYDGGSGNYASHSIDTIIIPNKVDINSFIHEIGHHYDHFESKEYNGLAKKSTYASSLYEIGKADEVFAENFKNYFIAPNWLKEKLPMVYNELDKNINDVYKNEIYKLIDSSKKKYKQGGMTNGKASKIDSNELKMNLGGNVHIGESIEFYERTYADGTKERFSIEDYEKNIYPLLEKELKMNLGGELAKGIKAEQEHSETIAKFKRKGISVDDIAKSIALDHIKEDSKYYTKLEKMENKKFDGGGITQEDNTFLYKINTELNSQGKGKWESDFEIIDNRDGQEFGEDASNWIVYNNVSGTSVDASSKKDAEDIIKNAPAYVGMWNEGEPIDFYELNTKQQENHREEFNRQKVKTKNLIDTRIRGLQIALKLAKAENKTKIEKRIKGLEIAQKIKNSNDINTNQIDSIEETNKYSYLMTLEEYKQSGIIDLLKEYRKFVKKNEKSLYSESYGSIADFRTLEEYIELGDKSPLYSTTNIMGLPNKKSVAETIIGEFIKQKTRYGKNPNDYEVASKEVIEQNKNFREKILKYFPLNKYGNIQIDNDELKSNKRAVRNAMEKNIYFNLIKDGKLSVDRLEEIADSVGVRITKETYSADKNAELKEYLKKIKIPQQNYEALLEFGKKINKDLQPIKETAYNKEYKRYSNNILESVGKTITSDRLSLLIPFWMSVVDVNKKEVKSPRGSYYTEYEYTILSVKSDWEKQLEKKVNDIVEELMFKIVTTIISAISFVKIPFKSVVSKEVKIGAKGFEGVYEINFTDGSKFDLVTQGIEAGGYNIQSFHYRYISKIEKMILPNGKETKDDSHFKVYKEIKTKFVDGGGVGKINYADGRKFRIQVKQKKG